MPARTSLLVPFVGTVALLALLSGCNRNVDSAPPPPPATAVLPGGPPIDASSPAVTLAAPAPAMPSGISSGAAPSDGGTLSVIPSTPPSTTAPTVAPPQPAASTVTISAGVPSDPAASPAAAGTIGTTRGSQSSTDQPLSVAPGSKQ